MKKEEIRPLFKERRAALTEGERNTLSKSVCEHLIQLAGELKPECVHLFLPIAKFHELDLSHFVEWLWKNNVDVLVPVTDLKTKQMINVRYHEQSKIEVSTYGIPEPIGGEQVDDEAIDLVIVPLLAVDERLNRVGYGAGFYDALFASEESVFLKVGVGFFEPMSELISDVRKEDVSLDLYYGPKGVYRAS